MVPTLILTLVIFLFFFLAVGIRVVLKKDKEFRGTCASKNPMLNQEGENCSLCGAPSGEACENDSENKSSELPKVGA